MNYCKSFMKKIQNINVNYKKYEFNLFVFLFITIFWYPASIAFGNSTVSVLEQTPQYTILEWTVPQIEFNTLQTDNGEYIVPICDDLAEARTPGFPILPVNNLLLENVDSRRITVLDTVYSNQSTHTICPAPKYLYSDYNSQPDISYKTGNVYQKAAFYPASFISTSHAWQRDNLLTRFAINPVLYNPVQNQMRVLRYIKIRINAAVELDLKNHTIRSKSGNAKLARANSVQTIAIDSWWEPYNRDELIKIETPTAGMYKITGEDLRDQGVQLSMIDPGTIKILNNGIEQPCQVLDGGDGEFNENDLLFFYADRLSGDNDYFHSWAVNNVYWLVWGGDAGLRYSTISNENDSGLSHNYFISTIHIEKDIEYYHGDTNEAIQETDITDGEGWVWTRALYHNSRQTIEFDLPGLFSGTTLDDSLRIRLRFRGMTIDSAENDHHLLLSVNDNRIGEGYFNNRQEWLPYFSVPVSNLLESGNQLLIESVATNAEISQVYFDWLEVDYPRALQVENGQLLIDSLDTVEHALQISGLQSDSVFVFNLREQKELVNKSVTTGKLLNIKVQSAAIGDGNYSRFLIENELIYEGTRGIGMVVINQHTGNVEMKRTFDTWGSTADADSLVAVVNRIADGRIVLCAIKDEGSNHLSEEQFNALETLGSSQIQNLTERASWALIGRKGAEPGTAIEVLSASGEGPAHIDDYINFTEGDGFVCRFNVPEKQTGPFVVFDIMGLKQPLLEKIQLGELSSVQNGADYIIVTHPDFMASANQLAAHRQTQNGFRTYVANVNEIYNEFNYGIKDPVAVKRFLEHAYNNWQKPAPEYVVMLGDASWDPLKNSGDDSKEDFVPVYGNPVSDVWYACMDGEDDIVPDMNIGRIPVESEDQAQNYLDKIMEYESTAPASWKKNFLFISGGFDQYEQLVFGQQSQTLIDDFVSVPPVGGNAILIGKETTGLAEGEHRDDLLNTFDDGIVWANFIGHAGSSTWDLMFHNPDIDLLNNGPKYPFITSMTCHTGRFAEPNQDSFGEYFLRVVDKGAVAFWGTAGWGYTYEDYMFLRQLYPIMLQNSVQEIGKGLSQASAGIWSTLGEGLHVRNIILQYVLLGDPALDLALPDKPDLAIGASDIRVYPTIPSEADSLAEIHVAVNNFGLLPEDSVTVLVTAELQNGNNHRVEYVKKLAPVYLSDSVKVDWELKDMTGLVNVTASVDPNQMIDEDDETNNTASQQVTVVSNVIRLLYPHDQAICSGDDMVLSIRNPQATTLEDYMFEFQLDTSSTFNSGYLKTYTASPGLLTTEWAVGDLASGIYYWRCRNTNETAGPVWIEGSFLATNSNDFGWGQSQAKQFSENNLENTQIHDGSIVLYRDVLTLNVESAGIVDGNYARLLVNSNSVLETSRGINLVALSPQDGSVLFQKCFDTYADGNTPDSMALVISEFADSTWVLAAIKDEGSNQLNETAYTALESIGSQYCRDLQYRDSWAIIGKKGAPVGSVSEEIKKSGEGFVSLLENIEIYKLNGTVSTPLVGPSTNWRKCNVKTNLPEQTSILFNVLGIRSNGIQDTLISQTNAKEIDLAGIDGKIYPFLKISGTLITTDFHFTPSIHQWAVNFQPSPDFAVSQEIFSVDNDTILVGSDVEIRAQIYNLGKGAIVGDTLNLGFFHIDTDGNESLIAIKRYAQSILPDSMISVSHIWNSEGLAGIHKLKMYIDPENHFVELDKANNIVTTSVYVLADTIKPEIAVTIDGREIMYGDWVASQPTILVDITDNRQNTSGIVDTSMVTLFLDDQRVSYNSGQLQMLESDEVNTAIKLEYKPVLADGEHYLTVMTSDPSNNSSIYQTSFNVINELAIRKIVNYPNPFETDTHFTFELSQPANVRVKIYTVAGRLINDLDYGWQGAGYNMLPWDGTDADGDVPANGVYIYKIVASEGDENAEAISKCILMK